MSIFLKKSPKPGNFRISFLSSFCHLTTSSKEQSIYQYTKGKKIVYTTNETTINPQKEIIDDTLYFRDTLMSMNIPSIFASSKTFRRFTLLYLPQNYPHSTTEFYLPYVTRSFIGSIFGSANFVLATQSLLFALGLGSSSIPISATLNWILKDGFGQFIAMYLSSYISKGFDAYVRRWRFQSALFQEIGSLLEVITPLFGYNKLYFLILASISNSMKNICWLSASSSKAHINKHFAKQENLADLTSKSVSRYNSYLIYQTYIYEYI